MSTSLTGTDDPGQTALISGMRGGIDRYSAEISTRHCPWPSFMQGQETKPVRVILIDDDACVRRVIAQELLSDLRIHLQGQGGSLKEGRRLLGLHEFDVLLVDLRLGDGTGFELIHHAKRHRSGAEIIVISATEDESQILHAFELGASGYLLKNAWAQSYAEAVLQVVNGGAAISPSLSRRLLVNLDFRRPDSRTDAVPEVKSVLSNREREVLRLIAKGRVTCAIAECLVISAETVNAHVKNICRKLDVHTRAEAVSSATRRGLLGK